MTLAKTPNVTFGGQPSIGWGELTTLILAQVIHGVHRRRNCRPLQQHLLGCGHMQVVRDAEGVRVGKGEAD
jgi:hypothetical protein